MPPRCLRLPWFLTPSPSGSQLVSAPHERRNLSPGPPLIFFFFDPSLCVLQTIPLVPSGIRPGEHTPSKPHAQGSLAPFAEHLQPHTTTFFKRELWLLMAEESSNKRTRASGEVLEYLLREFDKNQNPTPDQRKEISERTNMS